MNTKKPATERVLVDFAEILIRSFELLDKNAELLKHYQDRFQHILVDEFQDTNKIQYLLLKKNWQGKWINDCSWRR